MMEQTTRRRLPVPINMHSEEEEARTESPSSEVGSAYFPVACIIGIILELLLLTRRRKVTLPKFNHDTANDDAAWGKSVDIIMLENILERSSWACAISS